MALGAHLLSNCQWTVGMCFDHKLGCSGEFTHQSGDKEIGSMIIFKLHEAASVFL
jgi:hypothetical protein